MKVNKFIVFGGLLLFGSEVIAQETKPTGLKQAIQRVLEVNKTLKVEKTGVELAENKLQSVKDARLPEVAVSGQYMYLPFSPNVNLKFQQAAASSSSSSSAAAAATPVPKSLLLGQLNASLPIFTGFKLKNNILQSQKGIELSQLSSDIQSENIVWQTINLYYGLYKTNEAIGVLNENIKRSENRIKDYENFVANGLLAENDLLKAKLQKSNVELSLEEARNTYNNLQFRLNTWLQQDAATPIVLENLSVVFPEISNTPSLVSSRKDISILAKKAESSKIGIDLAKAAYYPNIALNAGYIGLNIDKLASVTNAVNFGLGFKYNISSIYKNKVEVKAAELQFQQAEQRIAEAEDKAKIEISEATRNYELAGKKIKVYQEALKQANENLRIVTNKNKNGLADTDQLLEADVQQLQAEINEKIGKVEQQLAYYQVLYTSGTLLDYLQIKK